MDPLDIRRTRAAQTNTKTPLRETASQTAGPYVHIGCLPSFAGICGIYSQDLVDNGLDVGSTPINIVGSVLDGEGALCNDVMLEFWHADEFGKYQNGHWRRTGTNLESGLYDIQTTMPGSVQDEHGNVLAPFINVWITARGINIGLLTRVYFPQFQALNDHDPHLKLIDIERRHTLIASIVETSTNDEYRFDIHLQGQKETVFFDV